MTNLNVQIPNFIYKQIEAKAIKENVSIDQLVTIALTAQVSTWAGKDYVETKKARGSLDKLKQALNKVPDVKPEDYDKLA